MIPRYTRPVMGNIWTDENRFKIWLDIELLATEKQEALVVVPKGTIKKIRESLSSLDYSTLSKRALEIEEETKHDVIAFLTAVAEYVGPDSRFIHLGMTSIRHSPFSAKRQANYFSPALTGL